MKTQPDLSAMDERLLELLYGELPPEAEAALLAEVNTDPVLRTRLAAWQAVRSQMAELPEPEPDPQVGYHLLRTARQEAAGWGEKKGFFAWLSSFVATPAFAGLGVAVLAVGGWLALSQNFRDSEAPSQVTALEKAAVKAPELTQGGEQTILVPPRGAAQERVAEAKLEEKPAVEPGDGLSRPDDLKRDKSIQAGRVGDAAETAKALRGPTAEENEKAAEAPGTLALGDLDERSVGNAKEGGVAAPDGFADGQGDRAGFGRAAKKAVTAEPADDVPKTRRKAEKARDSVAQLDAAGVEEAPTRRANFAPPPAPAQAEGRKAAESPRKTARPADGKSDVFVAGDKGGEPAPFPAEVQEEAAPTAAPVADRRAPEPDANQPRPPVVQAADNGRAVDGLTDAPGTVLDTAPQAGGDDALAKDAPVRQPAVEVAAAAEAAPAQPVAPPAEAAEAEAVNTNEGDADEDQAVRVEADGESVAGAPMGAATGGTAPPRRPASNAAPAAVREAGREAGAGAGGQAGPPPALVEARAARSRGDHEAATEAYQRYFTGNSGDSQFATAMLEAAQSYETLGDVGRAMQLYRLAARSGDPRVRALAQARLGALESLRAKSKAAPPLPAAVDEQSAPDFAPAEPDPAPPEAP